MAATVVVAVRGGGGGTTFFTEMLVPHTVTFACLVVKAGGPLKIVCRLVVQITTGLLGLWTMEVVELAGVFVIDPV